MADTIRPTFIGFAFGAAAGVAIGLWYAGGMGKIERAELEKELEAAEARITEVQERSLVDAKAAAESARAELEACEKAREVQPSP